MRYPYKSQFPSEYIPTDYIKRLNKEFTRSTSAGHRQHLFSSRELRSRMLTRLSWRGGGGKCGHVVSQFQGKRDTGFRLKTKRFT
jgi:hypothetical protein